MRWLPHSPLARFFLLVFLWLPFWFAFWYFASGVLMLPAVSLSHWLLNLLQPGLIDNVKGLARHLTFVTTIEVAVPGGPPGTAALVTVNTNALVYSWNLPVLLALFYAADERIFSFTRITLAYVVLIPLHVWGITFEVLKTVAFQSGPVAQARLGYSELQMEAIALGYQFGALMLPVIGAATIWIAMNGRLLRELLEAPASVRSRAKNSK